MRTLAIDPGKRRFGIAISDGLGLTSRPLTTLDKKQSKNVILDIVGLVQAHEVGCIVLGLPLESDGAIGPSAKRSLHFKGKLEQALLEAECRIPVHSLDESYTTTEAYARLRSRGIHGEAAKKVVDEEAAAVLLEGYLRESGTQPES